MATTTQTRKIVISVDTNGNAALDDIAAKLGGINKSTKELSTSMSLLSSITGAFIGGLTISELVGFSDQIQNLNNRLIALTGSQEGATSTMNALVQTARDTNQSVEAVSTSYLRMSQALKDANISQASLIDLTKTISNTFRISGASTSEAANATIQLGQAFSLGVLRGQDLRSIMEQNVVLTRLLRKEFGNNLLKDAQAGLISVPKIMEILFKNMQSVNEQAKTLSATFDQSLTKALDAFKLKVFEISNYFNASGLFAKGIQFAVDNMGALVTVGTILALATLPQIALQIASVTKALIVMNPWTLALVAGLTAVSAIFADKFDLTSIFTQIQAGFSNTLAVVYKAAAAFKDFEAQLTDAPSYAKKFKDDADALRQTAKDYEAHAEALHIEADAQAALAAVTSKAADAAQHAADVAKAKKAFSPDQTAQQRLAELNKLYISGADSVEQYNKSYNDLNFGINLANQKFKEGKINLEQLQEAQEKVDITKLNFAFRDGEKTIDQFNTALRGIELRRLNEELESGKISLADYNSKLAAVSDNFTANGAFRTGLQDYLTSIGTTTSQVAKVITSAFSQVEDALVDFTKTGKLNFDKMTSAILDDLERIILRATIIQPLATGILGALQSPTTPTTVNLPASNNSYDSVAALGNVYDGGLRKFATGGVVSSPTMFGYGNNKTGLMGEAGPEAILPLSRGSGGALGVQATVTPVTVNVINQSGNEVTQTESTGPSGEKTLDILITNKVRDAIGTGKLDKIMKASYGLNRRGN